MYDSVNRRKRCIGLISILVLLVTALTVSYAFATDETSGDEIEKIFEQHANSESARSEYHSFGATTRYFNVEIKVNKDYSYEVTETIDVLFNWGKHGIVRYIPLTGNYKIKDISAFGDEYKVSKEEGNLVIRIGNGNRYVSGEKVYKIKYTIQNYLQSKTENHIYVDVVPTNWEMTIMSTNAVVKLPNDFNYTKMKSYVGHYGSTDNKGTWTYDEQKNQLNYSASMIPSKNGVTLLAYAPKAYWQGALSKEWSNLLNAIIIVICLISIVIIKYKSKKSKDIIAPITFNPPEGITPAELGYLVDEQVDREDVVSLYLYLASKGIIQIKEGEGKKDTIICALKTPVDEPAYVQKFYQALFKSTSEKSVGRELNLKDAGEQIGESYKTITDQIESKFQGRKSIYSKKSETTELYAKIIGCAGFVITLILSLYRSNMYIYGISSKLSFVAFFVFAASIWGTLLENLRKKIFYRKSKNRVKGTMGLILSSIAYVIYSNTLIYFSTKGDTPVYIYVLTVIYVLLLPFLIIGIKLRSDYNRKIYGEILGFRNFIETAEIGRINELVDENPSYFYDVLPYAYVFKLSNKWIKKFETIRIPEHLGYAPHGISTFDYIRMNTLMHSIEKSTFDGISASNSDSGGGIFSGGGFSGGGAGGGGGGAW